MGNFGLSPITEQSGGTNAVWTVTVTGGPTGGDFTITVGGDTTGAIAYNASAATVDTALEAIAYIPAGGVSVARSGAGTGGNPYVYTITFTGGLAGTDVGAVTASGAGLTGGTAPDAVPAEVTEGVAPVIDEYLVQDSDQVAVMLVPSADVAGDVTVSLSIDGGSTWAIVHTETMVASTNILIHIVTLPATHLKVDNTALTSGSVDVQLAKATRS
jgi:hypothetical protein